MICYFANRRMEILAHASTRLMDGLHIKDDKKIEEIEAGQDVFSGYLCYGAGQRLDAEAAAEVGNYILKQSKGEKDEFYTIIDSECDPLRREIYFYAESAGLDLIGEVFEPYEATELMTFEQYISMWTADSGFEIGVNEAGTIPRMLFWDDSETATERILSTASKFGVEVSYRFDIDRLSVKHKYIDFYKKRGSETMDPLRRGRDYEDLRIKKSLAEIATGLRVTGGTPDGAGVRRQSDGTFTWVKFSEYCGGRDEENAASIADDPDGMQFIGISPGHATDEESEDPDDYAWGMINKKSTMIIVPSTTGHRQWKNIDGKARYTWIMFATDEFGSNMSDYPEDRTYVGIATNKTSATKSTLASNYTWVPINSNEAGRDIYISPGGSGIPEGNGQYTWIKYADDAEGNGISNSPVGKSFIGMRFHHDNQGESGNAQYYEWAEINLNTVDGGFVRATFCHPGIKMPDGTFVWYWFAKYATGANRSWGTSGRPYLGIAYGKSASLQSWDPADYEWYLIDADETQAVTLKGMGYDDGDFYVDPRGYLLSRTALQKWSRYVSPDETGDDVGHIIAEFESDATDQAQLLTESIAELTRRREPEITYELELIQKPDTLKTGDTVPIVDPEGEIFLTARLLKLETCEEKGTYTATFGEYRSRAVSLSERVAKLTKEQREAQLKQYQIYTWTVYADSPTGDGIRLEPDGALYMGVANNKASPDPDLSDPYAYTWTRVAGWDGEDGADGEDAVTLRIDSTRGLVFKNNWYDTQLRVTVIKGGASITDLQALRQEFGSGAYLQWYFRRQVDDEWSMLSVSDSRITEGGFCLTVTPDDVDEQITFQCDLEV